MTYLIAALLIGIIAGLRAMTAPAAVAWAVRFGVFQSRLFGYAFMPWIFTVLALGELITDQLPSTPSRTVPVQFGTRLLMGALTGWAIGSAGGVTAGGVIAGLIGAAIGTLGGRAARGALARRFGSDPPAAFLEDAVAIVGAFLVLRSLA